MRIETERLILEPLDDVHLGPFGEMNADPRVMRYFPSTLTLDQSRDQLTYFRQHWHDHGFGLCAVSLRYTDTFLGFTGLTHPSFPSDFDEMVEIGWRFTRSAWGKGYATEAAKACREWAFNQLGLPQIISFTAQTNRPSRGVMERIGMVHKPERDFDHPRIPNDSPLQRHVFYQLDSADAQRDP